MFRTSPSSSKDQREAVIRADWNNSDVQFHCVCKCYRWTLCYSIVKVIVGLWVTYLYGRGNPSTCITNPICILLINSHTCRCAHKHTCDSHAYMTPSDVSYLIIPTLSGNLTIKCLATTKAHTKHNTVYMPPNIHHVYIHAHVHTWIHILHTQTHSTIHTLSQTQVWA